MKIAIVVAHSSNRVIGRDGGLPWHLSGDLKHFRELTEDHVVVMGRKTYDSIPEKFRPLPNRHNIVVSNQTARIQGVCVCKDIADALYVAERWSVDDPSPVTYVIGGASVYLQTLPLADEIHLTLVEDVVDGDARFPYLAPDEWREVQRSGLHFENDLQYRFLKYERIER